MSDATSPDVRQAHDDWLARELLALEQAFGNASEVIPPGQAASGSEAAKNPAGRHVLPGEGCE